jgi:hypothetical protein
MENIVVSQMKHQQKILEMNKKTKGHEIIGKIVKLDLLAYTCNGDKLKLLEFRTRMSAH